MVEIIAVHVEMNEKYGEKEKEHEQREKDPKNTEIATTKKWLKIVCQLRDRTVIYQIMQLNYVTYFSLRNTIKFAKIHQNNKKKCILQKYCNKKVSGSNFNQMVNVFFFVVVTQNCREFIKIKSIF